MLQSERKCRKVEANGRLKQNGSYFAGYLKNSYWYVGVLPDPGNDVYWYVGVPTII